MVSVSPLSENFGYIIQTDTHDSIETVDLSKYINLFKSKSGGVLFFKGFDVNDKLFRIFTEKYGKDFVTHHNYDIRVYPDNDTTLATVNVGNYKINFHTEMNRNPFSPDVFWMYCSQPVRFGSGGETNIVDGVKVLNELSETTRTLLEEQSFQYIMEDIPKDLWEKINLKISDPDELVEHLSTIPGIRNLKMDENGNLSFIFWKNPIRQSKFSKIKVFNCGLLDEPEAPLLGNGKPVPEDIIEETYQVTNKHLIKILWQKGDLLLIDNTRVMHGREAFTDMNRRILVRYSALKI